MTEIIRNIDNMRIKLLLAYFQEDAGRGDITTDALGIATQCRAEIIAKGSYIVAGAGAIQPFLALNSIKSKLNIKDGERCSENDVIFELEGDAAAILKVERLTLNLMGRMSGIATSTRKAVDIVKPVNPDIIITATRKTTPGFRVFEKDAVMIGGGHPHRYDLDEAILIKDNHLALVGDPSEAVKCADAHVKSLDNKEPTKLKFGEGLPRNEHKWIEVEASSLITAMAAAESGADIIMLDNMTPEQAEEAYNKLKGLRSDLKIEVSGGITLDNIKNYAKHADIISLGWLTHSAPSADFSLRVIKID